LRLFEDFGYIENRMTPQETVQVVAGILAVLCVAAIIWRRKAKKKRSAQDEF
jgi:membrane protein DedA with SNARE-associated domain